VPDETSFRRRTSAIAFAATGALNSIFSTASIAAASSNSHRVITLWQSNP